MAKAYSSDSKSYGNFTWKAYCSYPDSGTGTATVGIAVTMPSGYSGNLAMDVYAYIDDTQIGHFQDTKSVPAEYNIGSTAVDFGSHTFKVKFVGSYWASLNGELSGSFNIARDPAPTNVSINPGGISRTSIWLNRAYSGATYCQYNINNWDWINENTSYPNGVSVSGDTISNLSPNTTYSCQIRMGNGNSELTYSNVANATTLGNAPSVSGSSVSSLTYKSAYINISYSLEVNASLAAVEINYGTSTSYGSTSSSSSLSGLTPRTTYYYRARVKDNWNRWSGYTTGSFTTQDPPLPSCSAPTLIEATDSSLKVSATATPGDMTTITKIQFTVDDSTWVGTSSPTTITGLNDDTSYNVRAAATDNYGRTMWSDITVMRTLAGKRVAVSSNGGTMTKHNLYVSVNGGAFVKRSKDKIKISINGGNFT